MKTTDQMTKQELINMLQNVLEEMRENSQKSREDFYEVVTENEQLKAHITALEAS